MMERLIAYYCAPALAGIKPANIISIQKCPEFERDIISLNLLLNKRGIYIEILCKCKKRLLIMVYRKKLLEKHIFNPSVSKLLFEIGYPKNQKLNILISHLKERLNEDCNFPHEIGAFLGYPIHDIYGFINNEKELFTGYWKVYANADETKRLFERFDRCKEALLKRIDSGKSIAEIFAPA